MPERARQHGKSRRHRNRGTKQQRGYGGEWERISKMYRAQHPLCELRITAGCTDRLPKPAVDVDHVVPFVSIDDPNRTAWHNLQSVCRACHNKKTHGHD